MATIYAALRNKLGREPTNAELKADVDRIKTEALVSVAERGGLPHQKRHPKRKKPLGATRDEHAKRFAENSEEFSYTALQLKRKLEAPHGVRCKALWNGTKHMVSAVAKMGVDADHGEDHDEVRRSLGVANGLVMQVMGMCVRPPLEEGIRRGSTEERFHHVVSGFGASPAKHLEFARSHTDELAEFAVKLGDRPECTEKSGKMALVALQRYEQIKENLRGKKSKVSDALMTRAKHAIDNIEGPFEDQCLLKRPLVTMSEQDDSATRRFKLLELEGTRRRKRRR